MLIYGVCISEIKKIDEDKILNFLKELAESGSERDRFLENFSENQNANDGDYTIDDWLDDFEYNGYYGLAAFLKDVIEDVEGINISCDDPNGVHYLGLGADAPWMFNEKTKNISAEEYISILQKYVNKVTNEILEVRWWNVDDNDY